MIPRAGEDEFDPTKLTDGGDIGPSLVLDPFEVEGIQEPELPDRYVEYEPRLWAIPFHQSFLRWACLVLHRRAGKTTAILVHHQRAAVDDEWETARLLAVKPEFTDAHIKNLLRNRLYGHILPTRVQAKLVGWALLKFYAQAHAGQITINESELKIVYHGKHDCTVQLFGADNVDSFRGAAFSGVSFDEFGQQPPNIFSEVLSKSLADHLGYAIWAGTIRGKNHLYKTYKAAAMAPGAWLAIWQEIDKTLATEEDSTTIALRQAMHDDQALIAQGLMTQEEYDQEWFLSVEAAIKGAYYSKQIAMARRERRISVVPYDPALRVHDVWDLGKGPNMAVGCWQKVGREMHLIDYFEGAESDGLPQMIATLQRRPYVWGKHFGPHDIMATELGSGKTRFETCKKLGWYFEVVKDIGLADGINAARMMWPRLWIDEGRCGDFIEAVGQYRRPWNQKLGIFGDHPVHDASSHPSDMLRYAAVAEELMTDDKPRRQSPSSPAAGIGGREGWMQ